MDFRYGPFLRVQELIEGDVLEEMVETSTKRSEFIGVVNPGKRIKNRE
jgi:hypothetical protein